MALSRPYSLHFYLLYFPLLFVLILIGFDNPAEFKLFFSAAAKDISYQQTVLHISYILTCVLTVFLGILNFLPDDQDDYNETEEGLEKKRTRQLKIIVLGFMVSSVMIHFAIGFLIYSRLTSYYLFIFTLNWTLFIGSFTTSLHNMPPYKGHFNFIILIFGFWILTSMLIERFSTSSPSLPLTTVIPVPHWMLHSLCNLYLSILIVELYILIKTDIETRSGRSQGEKRRDTLKIAEKRVKIVMEIV